MRRCLVIAPFGKEDSAERLRSDEVHEYIIKPVMRESGYDMVLRSIDVGQGSPGEIAARVMRNLRDWELVVADLTGANPNVLYELALRHVTRLPYVLLSEAPEACPFFLTGLNIVRVRKDPAGLDATKKDLAGQIAAIHSGNADFETTAGRIFGSRTNLSRVCRWEIQYSPGLAREWLERQGQKVKDAINKWLEDGIAPESPSLRSRLVEYLAYHASSSQLLRGELHYIIARPASGDYDGHAVFTLAGSSDPQVIPIHGVECPPLVRMWFYQPPRKVSIGPGLNEEIRGFQYSIEFAEKGDGTLEGDFNHPECPADNPLRVGKSRLVPV
jgi:hypothetical protein